MKNPLQSQKGFTGIEIAVALVILMIFVSLISTIFINVYLTFTDAQRNSVATGYATQIAETIDKMYYAEVEESNITAIISEMNIPNGYTISVQIDPYVQNEYTQDLVKMVGITVSYKVGNNTKTVNIETTKSKEILITPNKPKVSEGMVPVKYVATENDGYWIITTEDDSTWYNYDNKRWANIMLQDGLTVEDDIEVTDENRKSLAGKKVTTLGSMFVWIPRYAYKIPEENLHTSNAGEIDIVFLYSTSANYVDTNGDLQPISDLNKEAEGNLKTTDVYRIHPSFQDGSKNNYANGGWDTELTGYWVAKFEASSTDTDATYGGGDTTELDVKVLPNVPSWRLITASNMFEVCKNMTEEDNIYNISNNVEPHMMKNTEWGAVAYLSRSKYGKNEQIWNNPYCTAGSDKTILTGKVATSLGPDAGTQAGMTECDSYNEGNGPEGSTTGNVYGIYDMAGGSWENVAAFLNNERAASLSSIANMYQAIGTKYVDVYIESETGTQEDNYKENYLNEEGAFGERKYGDAIYETSASWNGDTSWDGDSSVFPYGQNNISITRGRSYYGGTKTGIFFYSALIGNLNYPYSFRPVITIP